VNLERIGTVYAVHRATVARWLADVRRRTLLQVEQEVNRHAALTQSEFRNVLGWVVSDLDASVTSLLGDGGTRTPPP
jgi:hypothetical protein